MISLLLNIVLLFNTQGNYDTSVQQYLESKVKDCSKIEVSLLGDWNRYSEVRIREDKAPKISGNIAYIPVIIKTPRGESSSSLTVEIKKFDKVLVATKDISRFEELTPGDFELKLSEITLVKKPVKSFTDLRNKMSSEFIRKGEALSALSITGKPSVNIGDRLKAHSIAGNVDVTIAVVARQSGREGETIRVRTMQNNLFKAKVMDSNNVLIIE